MKLKKTKLSLSPNTRFLFRVTGLKDIKDLEIRVLLHITSGVSRRRISFKGRSLINGSSAVVSRTKTNLKTTKTVALINGDFA